MDRKKPPPLNDASDSEDSDSDSGSSSDSSGSGSGSDNSSGEEFETDEEVEKQQFVRKENDTKLPVKKSAEDETTTEEESKKESEADKAVESKPTTQVKAAVKEADSSGSESGSEYDSDSSSELHDQSRKSINRILAHDRKPVMNGSAKKGADLSSVAQKILKEGQRDEQSAKKVKIEASKRSRDDDSEEKATASKRKKDNAENGGKGEQNLEKSRSHAASKETPQALKPGKEKHASEKKAEKEKASTHDAGKEVGLAKKSTKQRMEAQNDSQLQPSGKSNRSEKERTLEKENGSEKKTSIQDKEGKLEKKSGAAARKHLEPENTTRKQKVQNPAASDDANLQPKLSEAVKEPTSPQKPKKPAQIWTPKDEIALSSEVLRRVKSGSEIPNKKNDEFWAKLSERLRGKVDGEWTKDQLCEKVKRMKTRYHTMTDKMKESQKPYKHRNHNDQVLFGLWSQIWVKADASKQEENDEAEEEKVVPGKQVLAAGATGSTREAKSTQDSKKEPETPKGTQLKKTSNESEDSDSEESDDSEGPEGNGLTPTSMVLDQKNLPGTAAEVLDIAHVPSITGLNAQGDGKLFQSSSDTLKFLQDGIGALLLEMQDSSKRMLEEFQAKSMVVVENAVKATADKLRLVNGMGFSGMGGYGFPPFRSPEFMDFQLSNGDQAFQQQWYELHIQELEVFSQRLQLMQQQCRLQQEQLKLQLERGK